MIKESEVKRRQHFNWASSAAWCLFTLSVVLLDELESLFQALSQTKKEKEEIKTKLGYKMLLVSLQCLLAFIRPF